MAHDPLVPSFTIGGVPVSATDMDGLIAAVGRRLAAGPAQPGTFVVFRDAHGVVRSQKDEALRAAHHDALLVCADGRPVSWIGRWRGLSTTQQVPGIESVEAVCRAGADKGWRHYFLGGGEGVADLLATTMRARVPGLQVAGVETPPFRPLSEAETEAMRARIRASGAQIVWVGLGTPKQEMFMAAHARTCRARSPWGWGPPSTSRPGAFRGPRRCSRSPGSNGPTASPASRGACGGATSIRSRASS